MTSSVTYVLSQWKINPILIILFPCYCNKKKQINSSQVVFYNNMEKVQAELALFSMVKKHALHLTPFLLSVLL